MEASTEGEREIIIEDILERNCMHSDVKVGWCQQLRGICKLSMFGIFFKAGNEELLNINENT